LGVAEHPNELEPTGPAATGCIDDNPIRGLAMPTRVVAREGTSI